MASMTEAALRFAPVARRNISEEIRDVLVDKIRTGELAPGVQLPSERELCGQFGVARTSVREAVQGLFTLGVLEKRGNRAHVIEHLPDVNFDDDKRKRKVRELFEVRRVVEVPIARLASHRATDEQRREILALAEEFTTELPLDEFRRRDRGFHSAIARACGNDVLAELHAKVLDTLFRSGELDELLNAEKNLRAVRVLVRDASEGHRAIARGIADGDLANAAIAAEQHLDAVEHHMISRLT
jgi:GntR family transcriptional repressor for pyruvate dehydrogenase complex